MIEPFCHDSGCSFLLRLAQIFNATFLAVLFLQSGLDKILDRKGNLDWLTEHFAKSMLAGHVPLLLSVVTAAEVVAGALSAVGVLGLLASTKSFAAAGASMSAVSLLMLFVGQRLAKDYTGAAVLVPYFILTILSLCLLAV